MSDLFKAANEAISSDPHRWHSLVEIDTERLSRGSGQPCTLGCGGSGDDRLHAAPSFSSDGSVRCRIEDRVFDAIDALVAAGKASSKVEAAKLLIEHYGASMPIAAPIPKQKTKKQSFPVVKKYNPALAAPWFPAKGISENAFQLNGGELVEYCRDTLIGIPSYPVADPSMPCRWTVYRRLGIPFKNKDGSRCGSKSPKAYENAPKGLAGLYALQHRDEAEVIIKAEGITDMLAAFDAIPDELRTRYIIVSNPHGASENPDDSVIEFFRGKIVYVVPDIDEPGQAGGQKWANKISTVAAEVRIVTPVFDDGTEGKDLRDYLRSGKTFCDFLALAEDAPIFEPPDEPDPEPVEYEPYGKIDSETGKMVLSLDRTRPTAEAFVKKFYSDDDQRTIFFRGGEFYTRNDNCYRPTEKGGIETVLFDWLHDAITLKTKKIEGENVITKTPFPAKNTTVKSALDAVETFSYIPTRQAPPFWMGDDSPPVPDPAQIIFGKTKNLYLPTMQVFDPSPKWFNLNALDFDYDPTVKYDAPRWNRFLMELFEDDAESIDTLMEFIGLLLTPITKFQKMLFIVGPKRSGKGTIAKVIRELVGSLNCCGPTTGALASQFGLQPLIGKTVGIVSDARFGGNDIQTLVERLLCISGEDTLTIDRKYMESVTMQLPTRFVFLSNEVPRLADASGALASRFVILKLTKSFFGNEDHDLDKKLMAELPAILNIALRGLRDLFKRGRFIQPESARAEVEMLEDLGSPIGRFVKERCQVGPDLWAGTDDLWNAWKEWCEDEGINGIGTKETFFRNLNASASGIVKRQCRDSAGSRFRKYEGISLNRKF